MIQLQHFIQKFYTNFSGAINFDSICQLGGNYSSSRILDILYLDLGLKQDKLNMQMKFITSLSKHDIHQYKITNSSHIS